MTYAWASRDRLCPMRMVWPEHNYNWPKYELRRLRITYSSLRAGTRLHGKPGSKIERRREEHRRYVGRLGEQPHWRPDHRKRKRRRSSLEKG
jgi:hypothetical protein